MELNLEGRVFRRVNNPIVHILLTGWSGFMFYGALQGITDNFTELPLIHWADYTSPARRIRYLFFTRIFDKRMRRLLTGVAVPHSTPEGTAVYTSWLSDQRLIAPMVILPHAWRRYRERTGCDLTGTDLYRHFFTQNPHGCDSKNQQAVARSVLSSKAMQLIRESAEITYTTDEK